MASSLSTSGDSADLSNRSSSSIFASGARRATHKDWQLFERNFGQKTIGRVPNHHADQRKSAAATTDRNAKRVGAFSQQAARRRSILGGPAVRLNFDESTADHSSGSLLTPGAKKTAISSIRSELCEQRAENAKLLAEKSRLQRRMADDKENFRMQIDELNSRLRKAEMDLCQLPKSPSILPSSEKEEKTSSRDVSIGMLREMQTERDQMREKLQALESTSSARQVEFECELRTVKSNCATLETELANARAQMGRNEATVKKLEDELKCARVELETEKIDVQRARHSLRQLQEEDMRAVGLRQELAELDTLREQVKVLTAKCDRMSLQRDNVYVEREKNAQLQAKFDQLSRDYHKRTSICSEYDAQLTAASARLGKIVTLDSIGDVLSELDRRGDELIKAKQMVSELTGKCRELESRTVNYGKSPMQNETGLDGDGAYQEEMLKKKQHEIDDLKELLRMKGDYNPESTQVLHMEFNPADNAHEQYKNEMQSLKEENSRLQLRVRQFEAARAAADTSTTGAAASGDVTQQVQLQLERQDWEREMAALRQQLERAERQHQRTKEVQSQLVTSLRETCAKLLGYQITMKGANMWRVESTYMPQEADRHFMIQFDTAADDIQLLDTNAANAAADLLEEFLGGANSFPAFFAAFTLRQYEEKLNAENEGTLGEEYEEGAEAEGADMDADETIQYAHQRRLKRQQPDDEAEQDEEGEEPIAEDDHDYDQNPEDDDEVDEADEEEVPDEEDEPDDDDAEEEESDEDESDSRLARLAAATRGRGVADSIAIYANRRSRMTGHPPAARPAPTPAVESDDSDIQCIDSD